MNDDIVIGDYYQHYVGEREVVDWDRPDGRTYRDVPLVYVREVTCEDYLRQKPHMRGRLAGVKFFWEVSVD